MTNALLFKPWRAPDAHDLVQVYHRMPRASGEMLVGISAPELAFLQAHATTVDVAGTRSVGGPLADGATIRGVRGRLVTGNYFDVLEALARFRKAWSAVPASSRTLAHPPLVRNVGRAAAKSARNALHTSRERAS